MLKSINAILFSLLLGVAASPSSYLYAQERDRLITRFKSGMRTTMREAGGSPMPTDIIVVEVLGFNLAGVPINLGEPFKADNDWLKNLRARVKNISGKPISHLHIIFALPEAKFEQDGRPYSMGFSLEYNPGARAKDGDPERSVVLPGDEVECGYIESGLPLRQQIANRTGVTTITLLQFGGDVNVFFVDGSHWRGSNLPMSTGTKIQELTPRGPTRRLERTADQLAS